MTESLNNTLNVIDESIAELKQLGQDLQEQTPIVGTAQVSNFVITLATLLTNVKTNVELEICLLEQRLDELQETNRNQAFELRAKNSV